MDKNKTKTGSLGYPFPKGQRSCRDGGVSTTPPISGGRGKKAVFFFVFFFGAPLFFAVGFLLSVRAAANPLGGA